ncbi:MAG: cobalamin biosynthesis protein CobQ [Rhodobacteraceae bacterium]|nr:cobalamin biosynthesis protein CobQ [Paracoccaceae bacterium]
MNTPTHLILAAAVFAKPGQKKVTAAALLGGFLPDFSLYFMFFWHRFVLNVSENQIFGQLYYSDRWQSIFAVDNSFLVWALILALALVVKRPWLVVLAGAALLHLCFDFPLHNDDARAHFWPISLWRFESPVSYWDSRHYGAILAPLEYIFALILLAILWRRFDHRGVRSVLAVTALLPLAPLVIFGWMFGGP